jgi:hypothetical protein
MYPEWKQAMVEVEQAAWAEEEVANHITEWTYLT